MSWLQTREASTLLVATFLASASLLLLTISHDNAFLYKEDEVALLGFALAFAGFLYRQFTSWITDRIDHNREADLAILYIANTTLDDELRKSITDGNDITRMNADIARRYVNAIRTDHELARKAELLFRRKQDRIYYVQASIREFLVVFFLFIPISFWLRPAFTSSVLPISCSIYFSIIVAVLLSVGEIVLRRCDRKNHPAVKHQNN